MKLIFKAGTTEQLEKVQDSRKNSNELANGNLFQRIPSLQLDFDLQMELVDHEIITILCAGDGNQFLSYMPADDTIGVSDEFDSENQWVVPKNF